MDSSTNPVAQSIDGATGDWSMSGDAMRWSPELADAGGELQGAGRSGGPPGAGLHGIELAAGLGAGLGLDVAGMRRLVSGALSSLGGVAGDVVTELRQLTRGSAEDEPPR